METIVFVFAMLLAPLRAAAATAAVEDAGFTHHARFGVLVSLHMNSFDSESANLSYRQAAPAYFTVSKAALGLLLCQRSQLLSCLDGWYH
jgi:hypothetical protein